MGGEQKKERLLPVAEEGPGDQYTQGEGEGGIDLEGAGAELLHQAAGARARLSRLESRMGRPPQKPGSGPEVEEKNQKEKQGETAKDEIAVSQTQIKVGPITQRTEPPQVHHEVHVEHTKDHVEDEECETSENEKFEPAPETGHGRNLSDWGDFQEVENTKVYTVVIYH